MGGFVLAWLTGEGIVIYRWAKLKAPPTPGALALSSFVFVGLAVIGQYQPARTAATVTAWAFDLAILLQVVGKAPSAQTGWPPPLIGNPSVILPTGQAAPSSSSASTGSSAAPAKGHTPLGSVAEGIKNTLL